MLTVMPCSSLRGLYVLLWKAAGLLLALCIVDLSHAGVSQPRAEVAAF